MPDVYISHAPQDNEQADRFDFHLLRNSITTWVDHNDTYPGDNWVKVSEKAMTDCLCLLVILSPRWIKSENCLRELTYCQNLDKKVYVVITEAVGEAEYPLSLVEIQAVEMTGDIDADSQLTSFLDTLKETCCSDRRRLPMARQSVQIVSKQKQPNKTLGQIARILSGRG